MRTVRYTILPGVGPGEIAKTGTLADLVRAIPYLALDVLPPLRVLNDVLRWGEFDAGMSGGCRWGPFEIAGEEYRELAKSLDLPTVTEAPEWVQDYATWTIWEMERRRGVPSDDNRRLKEEYVNAEAAYLEARGGWRGCAS